MTFTSVQEHPETAKNVAFLTTKWPENPRKTTHRWGPRAWTSPCLLQAGGSTGWYVMTYQVSNKPAVVGNDPMVMELISVSQSLIGSSMLSML